MKNISILILYFVLVPCINAQVNYSNKTNEKSIVKGGHINSSNDLFAGFNNLDREYTGGLSFGIITDYLDLKIISFRDPRKWNSYKEVYFGFDVYTPDSLNICTNGETNIITCNIDTFDRPFASTTFIGRKKFLINKNGTKRVSTNFLIGVIGNDVGRKFQSILHRDISDSPHPSGWETQIANGGRFIFQYRHHVEWQIQKFSDRYQKYRFGYSIDVGSLLLRHSFNLGISNKRFLELDPTYNVGLDLNKCRKCQYDNFDPSSKPFKRGLGITKVLLNRFRRSFFYDLNMDFQVVYHNAYLQGLRILDKTKNIKEHTIEHINPGGVQIDLTFGFKLFKSTFYWKHVLVPPEYLNGIYHNYAVIGVHYNI